MRQDRQIFFPYLNDGVLHVDLPMFVGRVAEEAVRKYMEGYSPTRHPCQVGQELVKLYGKGQLFRRVKIEKGRFGIVPLTKEAHNKIAGFTRLRRRPQNYSLRLAS